MRFLEHTQSRQIPLIAGVATAGEVMLALEYGSDTLKLFPAEAIGGCALLKLWAAPFPQVQFCPTGGICLSTAPSYLALPNVLCVGGGVAHTQSVNSTKKLVCHHPIGTTSVCLAWVKKQSGENPIVFCLTVLMDAVFFL